jgi:hypothetical protein
MVKIDDALASSTRRAPLWEYGVHKDSEKAIRKVESHPKPYKLT